MPKKISRRSFLFKSGGPIISTLALANTTIYVVGSAFKSLDGQLTAGAKGPCYQHSMTNYASIFIGPYPTGFTGSCTSSPAGSYYDNSSSPTAACTGCSLNGGCSDSVSSAPASMCP